MSEEEMFRPYVRRGVGTLGLLLLIAGVAAADEGLQVTSIGNAGFHVSAGGRDVLIDALYGEGIGGYVPVPPDTLKKLEQAAAPYDAVDLVLATHHHPDHFDPQSVARHLRANPEARFISTPQAVKRLEQAVDDFASLASRVQAELPAEGQQSIVELPGIKVTVLNLHHGRGQDPPVENLGFVVELGGKRFLHVGDTEASYGEMYVHKLDRRDIDVQFIGFWELLRPARWRIYHNLAERTVATHIPRSNAGASYFGDAGSLEGALERIRAIQPPVVVFAGPLETKSIKPLPD